MFLAQFVSRFGIVGAIVCIGHLGRRMLCQLGSWWGEAEEERKG